MARSHYPDHQDRRRRESPSASSNNDRKQQRRGRNREFGSGDARDKTWRRRSSRSPVEKIGGRREYRHRRSAEYPESPVRDRGRNRSISKEDRYRARYREASHHDSRAQVSRQSRSISRSRSPPRRRSPPTRFRGSPLPPDPVRSRGPLPSQKQAFTSGEVSKPSSPAPEKEKPNFANTGRLAAESNTVTVNGGSVVLKYHEPPEARKPPAKEAWRLYVFKGPDLLEIVELADRSCWLIGREKLVVDFPVEHPSCSKQHAVIQYRYVEKHNEFGDRRGRVRPYLIDLESANGSTVNGESIPTGRYVELRDKDVLQFGMSTREYVLMLPPSD